MNDFRNNIFYIPFLHVEVRNWKAKKKQLKDLYPTTKAYEFSLTGTQNKSIKDLGFIDAVFLGVSKVYFSFRKRYTHDASIIHLLFIL